MSDHRWRKSSYSPDASNCVEVATTTAAVLIRDSKTTSGPRLGLSPTAWAVFLAHLTK
ncbi:DUF397 domain-containing protein [Streptomyces griseoincarnatus]|uniref:DUF397 domain-containing protein n=1 Tax=Streptomyces variabilis TaxID=67372 RepID=A0ABQ2TZH1_9ACTN|nr:MULTISPECIES: DUF397 domain-containing protein [Streptomyces]MQL64656.1 DUF397 domain-containing protein [Streptomyces vinaceus]GGP48887.1 hypothetical protein GCM10010265_28280 [Streptomyces griseoincarnatus]GGT57396.1 hypothetical protein GCM10010287_34430 [Streptomyces variabilis]